MFQVDLLLSFCSEMGFSSVVLVGHDDGGLLALKAAQRVQTSLNSFNVSTPSFLFYASFVSVIWYKYLKTFIRVLKLLLVGYFHRSGCNSRGSTA
jgi:pimeloyl-ACP methyl ester carboxylesterase